MIISAMIIGAIIYIPVILLFLSGVRSDFEYSIWASLWRPLLILGALGILLIDFFAVLIVIHLIKERKQKPRKKFSFADDVAMPLLLVLLLILFNVLLLPGQIKGSIYGLSVYEGKCTAVFNDTYSRLERRRNTYSLNTEGRSSLEEGSQIALSEELFKSLDKTARRTVEGSNVELPYTDRIQHYSCDNEVRVIYIPAVNVAVSVEEIAE